MPAVPTVLVKFRKGKGWGHINEEDFDLKLHELIEVEVEIPGEEKKEETTGDSESTGEGGEEDGPEGKTLGDMNRAELVEVLDGLELKLEDVPFKGGAVTNDEIRAYIVDKVPATTE